MYGWDEEMVKYRYLDACIKVWGDRNYVIFLTTLYDIIFWW
jgi:hypothetical protein